ncbi:1045_t:CDS:2 [Racocetra fulgida]|uniref:1045_t:CDS:1 n=1 Tax=Racocetra fulgida TaxID=60492 RepID=A0A9N9GMC6_9GLOM|nr:1045_t:CDS:2 [Racocetra fulgida]
MSSSKDKEQTVKQSKEAFAYKFWQEFQEERGGSTEKSVSVESNKIVNSDLEVVTSNNEIVPTITSLNQNFQTVTLDNKQNCYVSVKSYLTNLEKSEEKVMDFQISNLDHCIVNLVSSNVVIGAMHIKGLRDTVILAGPAAKLDQKNNKYDKVEDFNWLKQQASPNWRTVSENKILKNWPFLHADNSDDTTEETVSTVLNEILESQLIP